MPVGTGSINRAARTSKKAPSGAKNAEEKHCEMASPEVKKAEPARKEVVRGVSNECFQLTQELPIHLL